MKNKIARTVFFIFGGLLAFNSIFVSQLKNNAHQITTQSTHTSYGTIGLMEDGQFLGPYGVSEDVARSQLNGYNLLSGKQWTYNGSDYNILAKNPLKWSLSEQDSSVIIYHVKTNTLRKIGLADGKVIWQQPILDSVQVSYSVFLDVNKDLICLRFDTELNYSVCRFFDLKNGKEKFAVTQNLYTPPVDTRIAFRNIFEQTNSRKTYFFDDLELLFDRNIMKLYVLDEHNDYVFLGAKRLVATRTTFSKHYVCTKKYEGKTLKEWSYIEDRRDGYVEYISDKYVFYGTKIGSDPSYIYTGCYVLDLESFELTLLKDTYLWEKVRCNDQAVVGLKKQAMGVYDMINNSVHYLNKPSNQWVHRIHIGGSYIYVFTLSASDRHSVNFTERPKVYAIPLDFVHS